MKERTQRIGKWWLEDFILNWNCQLILRVGKRKINWGWKTCEDFLKKFLELFIAIKMSVLWFFNIWRVREREEFIHKSTIDLIKFWLQKLLIFKSIQWNDWQRINKSSGWWLHKNYFKLIIQNRSNAIEKQAKFQDVFVAFCLFKAINNNVIIISMLNNHTAYFAVLFYLQQFEEFILCLLCSSLSLSIWLQKQLCRSTIIQWNQFKRRNEKRHKNFR